VSRPTDELLALQADVEARARAEGLDVPEIVYELVDHDELSEIAAYGGFPVRYPHWRFGMDYDRLVKGHRWGLQRIYELVVNTRPVVAYLLRQNAPIDSKLVMAHVCGHADFFAHNAWFSHTDGDFMDASARHAARVALLQGRYGVDAVESFIDKVDSIDNLVDAGALGRARGRPGNAPPLEPEPAPGDVLGWLLAHGRLDDWQHEVLSILRDEAYYFLPQALTKVMNEGWASFWHSRLMTGHLLRDAEIVDYADHHAAAMGGDDGPKNPYKLGIELFRWIHERAGGDAGGGLAAAFDARAIHNDLTFVDNHLDGAFCAAHGLGDDEQAAAKMREATLASLTNGGQPVIRVAGMQSGRARELELEHSWSGRDLQMEQAEETLVVLAELWGGTVRLRTRVDRRRMLLTCRDGETSREYGEELGER